MGDLREIVLREKDAFLGQQHPIYSIYQVKNLGQDSGSGTWEDLEAELRASGPVKKIWAVLLTRYWKDTRGAGDIPTTEFYGLIFKGKDIAKETHRYAVQFGQELARLGRVEFTDQVPKTTEQ